MLLGPLPAGVDVHVVLMVGNGHSNAWVTPIDGAPTLFVALELLPPSGRDDILIVHELVHVAHVQSLPPALTRRPELEHHVGMRVWLEGIAVAASRHLVPGRSEHDYFFVDGPDWLEQCRAALPQMAARLLSELDICDAARAYSFVGVTDTQPWPSRAGYWIGDRVVTDLLHSGTTLHELLTWHPDRVVQTLRTCSTLARHPPTSQPAPQAR